MTALFQGDMRDLVPVPGPGGAERRVHHLPVGDHLPARQEGDGERHRGDARHVHHRRGPPDRQRHRGLQVSWERTLQMFSCQVISNDGRNPPGAPAAPSGACPRVGAAADTSLSV